MQHQPSIIDVRTREEFSEKHFPGAINIPLDELPLKMEEIKDMPRPIIAYCRSGQRSGRAVELMASMGITDAVNGGGLEDMENNS